MLKKLMTSCCLLSALLASGAVFADQALVLNRNFESDAINPSLGQTTFISGWLNKYTGNMGVIMPKGGGVDYTDMGNRGQVAYAEAGARFNQAVGAKVVAGETYTLTFDIGRDFGQTGVDFMARINAYGLGLAQLQLNDVDVPAGSWVTKSLTFTATGTMPIDKQLVVEFQNLAAVSGNTVHIDNVYLQTSSIAGIIPPAQPIPKTLSIINQDTTLNIPEDFANIPLALAELDDKYINNGVTVTLQVTNCSSQTYYQPIEIMHQHGERIRILGDQANPGACVLQFNGSSGFVLEKNNILGLLDGFHVRGNATNDTYGVSVDTGARAHLGSNMLVSDFHYGLRASMKGQLIANGVGSSFNTGAGFIAEYGGYLFASDAQSFSNASHGYFAVDGGEIQAHRSVATNNTSHGFYASVHGYIYAGTAEASGHGGSGFYAQEMSHIQASGSKALNNHKGYYCEYQSYMHVAGMTATGNDVNYSPAQDKHGNWRCGMNF